MPIYEYRCPKCGVFDHMQKITDKPLKRCPTCGSGKVSKQMSNPAFHLKGGGWYVTDYARKGNGAKGGESEAKSDTASSGDGKSEGKSEKKAQKKSESASAAA
ncbi:MAG: zinc ribbon domain-containing protein [Thermodesulfobacteriota bacterium]